MNKALEFIHKNTPMLLATVLAFAAGVLTAEATRQEPKDVYLDVETGTIKYDYSRLTPATCKTQQECSIAEAIAFYDEYKFPETIPILEPVDCSDLKGKERAYPCKHQIPRRNGRTNKKPGRRKKTRIRADNTKYQKPGKSMGTTR